MPESRFIFDSSRKPDKPPVLREPLTKDQILKLLGYLRKETFADTVGGFHKCRAVNMEAVLNLKQQFPRLNIWHLYCDSVYGITKTPGMACEHFTVLAEIERKYMWFDGTADQFENNEGETIMFMEDTYIDLLIDKVTEKLGGRWRLISPQ